MEQESEKAVGVCVCLSAVAERRPPSESDLVESIHHFFYRLFEVLGEPSISETSGHGDTSPLEFTPFRILGH